MYQTLINLEISNLKQNAQKSGSDNFFLKVFFIFKLADRYLMHQIFPPKAPTY